MAPPNLRPHVTVVIPVHNRVRLLQRAILSASRQDYEKIEIIVVDDGSSVDISAACEAVNLRGTPLRLIKNEKSVGAQRSRLIGANAASGEVVALLDSDDWWERHKISRQIVEYIIHPDALISCQSKSVATGRVIPEECLNTSQKVEDFIFCTTGGFLQSSTYLMDRLLLCRALSRCCDFGIHDDIRVALEVQSSGGRVIQINETLCNFDDTLRPDRISLDLDKIKYALNWFQENTSTWSGAAKAGYYAKDTVRRYSQLGKRLNALIYLFKGLHPGVQAGIYLRASAHILLSSSFRRLLVRAQVNSPQVECSPISLKTPAVPLIDQLTTEDLTLARRPRDLP